MKKLVVSLTIALAGSFAHATSGTLVCAFNNTDASDANDIFMQLDLESSQLIQEVANSGGYHEARLVSISHDRAQIVSNDSEVFQVVIDKSRQGIGRNDSGLGIDIGFNWRAEIHQNGINAVGGCSLEQ